jgi:hypothetical protein
MSKSFVGLAALGVLGFAIWKLLPIVLLPLLGGLLGLVAWVVKIAVVGGLVLLALWMFRKLTSTDTDKEAPAD